jgi:hypothetical protein
MYSTEHPYFLSVATMAAALASLLCIEIIPQFFCEFIAQTAKLYSKTALHHVPVDHGIGVFQPGEEPLATRQGNHFFISRGFHYQPTYLQAR